MSTWGDVASAVSKFAPILGNAVPGVGTVVGAGVGLAASVIAKALGTDPTPDSIMSSLSADPDAIVKLRQAEMDHEKDLASISAELEKARLLDVQSARARQSANPKDYTPQWLAGGVTLGFFGALAAVMILPLDNKTHDLLLVMIGALQTAWVAIISYYFGSSKDSASKTQMIADVGYAAASAPVTVHAAPAVAAQTINPPAALAPQSDIYRGS
jgi:hypothetical protein